MTHFVTSEDFTDAQIVAWTQQHRGRPDITIEDDAAVSRDDDENGLGAFVSCKVPGHDGDFWIWVALDDLAHELAEQRAETEAAP